MRRKRKNQSPLQIAATRRNLALGQALAMRVFLEELCLGVIARNVYESALLAIELRWSREKDVAKKT